jgi:hypothetical protein
LLFRRSWRLRFKKMDKALLRRRTLRGEVQNA